MPERPALLSEKTSSMNKAEKVLAKKQGEG
jgi:hypothetical protein